MIVIDTQIAGPAPELRAREEAAGNRVVHVPALESRATGIAIDLSGCDAAFVGSPRAERIAKEVLSRFSGSVFAAGPATARELLKDGIPVSAAGSGNGAAADFENFLKIRRVGVLAWISAAETAVDLDEISRERQIRILHFPVYETIPAPVDESLLNSFVHPLKWIFHSGKGVRALCPYVHDDDLVELLGSSAKKAFSL